jgi:hypothetical protein
LGKCRANGAWQKRREQRQTHGVERFSADEEKTMFRTALNGLRKTLVLALVLAGLAALVAVEPGGAAGAKPAVKPLVQQGGDNGVISGLVDDGNGAVSFNIDTNGDFFGTNHYGTITCPGPVTIVSEQHRDGGGHYDGSVNGNIYTWHTQCANFAGVHYSVQLKYSK